MTKTVSIPLELIGIDKDPFGNLRAVLEGSLVKKIKEEVKETAPEPVKQTDDQTPPPPTKPTAGQ